MGSIAVIGNVGIKKMDGRQDQSLWPKGVTMESLFSLFW
jgi:hypothetical protein